MVSNASDDFPEPEMPVRTTNRSRGISTVMFLRLCSRAPRTTIRSDGMIYSCGFAVMASAAKHSRLGSGGDCVGLSGLAMTSLNGDPIDFGDRGGHGGPRSPCPG